MAKLVYPIHFSRIGEVVKALMDYQNVAFCLTIGLLVIRDDHLELDLKVLYELLPKCEVNQLSLSETIERRCP
jgi:hypothetical protein